MRPNVRPVVAFVGNFGSGKTEVAVNFCLTMAAEGRRVRIADLDIVNPYFRCREARDLLGAHGIEVVLPPAQYLTADLPIIIPEIRGMIARPDGLSVLDVGGDDMGATVLASLSDVFRAGPYDLLIVLNASRPFTDTLAGCLTMIDQIERASHLQVTGIVGNTHLMEQTCMDLVLSGYDLTRQVAERRGVPVAFITAPAAIAAKLDSARVSCPVLVLERLMLPPWLPSAPLGSANFLLRL